MKDDKYKLLSQVAYLYFIEDISQQKISEKLPNCKMKLATSGKKFSH